MIIFCLRTKTSSLIALSMIMWIRLSFYGQKNQNLAFWCFGVQQNVLSITCYLFVSPPPFFPISKGTSTFAQDISLRHLLLKCPVSIWTKSLLVKTVKYQAENFTTKKRCSVGTLYCAERTTFRANSPDDLAYIFVRRHSDSEPDVTLK